MKETEISQKRSKGINSLLSSNFQQNLRQTTKKPTRISRIKNYLRAIILPHAFVTSKLDNCNSLVHGLPKGVVVKTMVLFLVYG